MVAAMIDDVRVGDGPVLIAERGEHAAALEGVLDRAFGPGRHAKTSERVRERGAAFAPELSRVAIDADGAAIGCCRIWRVRIGDAPHLFLGPLAVDPARQHAGLGAALVRAATAACDAAEPDCAVLLVGAPAFFLPLGFSVVPKDCVTLPGPVDPARLLWRAPNAALLEQIAGAVSGFRDASRS